MERLNDVYNIRKYQKDSKEKDNRIWKFTDRTGQNYVKRVMTEAEISGKKSSAKGLRHSFGVRAIENKIPISQLKEWMGHRFIDSTAIYIQAKGRNDGS